MSTATSETRAGLFGVTHTACTVVPFNTVAGRCARCGAPLTGRRTRWCSRACELVYEQNHYWNAARAAALRSGLNRCRKCGWSPMSRQLTLFPSLSKHGYNGDNWLEVNHIIPRNGKGYGTGCHHHQSNLEVLCHGCHVKVTKRQRIARSRIRSRRGDAAQTALAQDV